MTKEEEKRVIELGAKNQIILGTWSALSLAGGIGGVIYASKQGKGFWGKVGFFFLGSIAVSLPVGLIARPKLINNLAELKMIQASQDSKPNSNITGLPVRGQTGRGNYPR